MDSSAARRTGAQQLPSKPGPDLAEALNTLLDAVAARVVERIHPEIHQRDEILDVTGAARYLKISTRSLRRLVATGKLPVVRIGGVIRVDSCDLRELVEQSKDVALP